MKFIDRLGQLVAGATSQWIGPIRYTRSSVFGPTIRVLASSATCDTCNGPLRSSGVVVRFCSKACRHARHHTSRVRKIPWKQKSAA